MRHLQRSLRRLCTEQCGQDLVEYALLAVLIAVAAAAAIGLFGQALLQYWSDRIVATWPF
jgi:Flp pilus assembly pilin Flp